MFEKEDSLYSNSYPVRIVALRIEWMIYDPIRKSMSIEGHKLLMRILRSNDLEYFTMESLQLIIEFLYTKIKWFLLGLFFPLFLCGVIVQIWFIVYTETYISHFKIDKKQN